jgi:putative DNA primase/helicase
MNPAATLSLDAKREQRARQAGAVAATVEDETGFFDTDLANGRRLATCSGGDIRYTTQSGWLVWDGRRWAEDDRDVRIQGLAKACMQSIFDEIKTAPDRDRMMRHAKRSQGRRQIEAAIVLARSEPGILAALTDFDVDPWLLNVANGTINLRTGALQPHSRDDLITKLAPVEYAADASCESWDAFLWKISGESEELYGYLRRFVGYLLTGMTSEQVLHFLFGLGANGKSVFSEILADLLGEYAIVVSPELVMAKRHAGSRTTSRGCVAPARRS